MDPKRITQKDLSEYASYLISEFYSGNLDPYFNALADDAIWIGPGDGQLLRSKAAIRKSFLTESGILRYRIGAIYSELVPHSRNQCTTISFFERVAVYPDESEVPLQLVFQLAWVKREHWLMSVIGISIRHERDERDKVYPIHSASPHFAAGRKDAEPRRVLLRQKNSESTLFLDPEEILWAAGEGHYCTVYLPRVSLSVACDLKELTERCGGALLRCHSGYAVNPYFIKSISRFKITLADGREIPVPEKKYTRIKRRLTEVFTPAGNGYEEDKK